LNEPRQLGDGAYAELGSDGRPVLLHGALADTEVARNLLVQPHPHHMLEHFALACSQAIEACA
jgi:hypothetical protein